ncbi:MAG: hypothetical protein ACXWE7_11685 [Nitrososphaeraceae archaeon]
MKKLNEEKDIVLTNYDIEIKNLKKVSSEKEILEKKVDTLNKLVNQYKEKNTNLLSDIKTLDDMGFKNKVKK